MKGATHFAISEFPLKSGRTIKAECGKKIKKARIEPIWDDSATGTKLTLPESTFVMCSACVWAILNSQEPGPRKIWAIRERTNEKSS